MTSALTAEIFGPDILIVLAVVALLFGSTRLPKLARSLGSASTEFKKGMEHGETDPEPKDSAPASPEATPASPPAPAALPTVPVEAGAAVPPPITPPSRDPATGSIPANPPIAEHYPQPPGAEHTDR
ncbi:MAG: twin-arginine translocase TatA/TatE family subunit [Acidimicrobiales bacterium]